MAIRGGLHPSRRVAGLIRIGNCAPKGPSRAPRSGALHQRLSETQSPLALGRRFRYLVLPEFHLDMRQSPAQCMEWDAVVHLWIQTVWLIISDNHVAGPTQRSEHRVGKAAVEMAGESDFPGPWFAGKRSRHGMNGNSDGLHASRLAFQQDRFDRIVIRMEPALDSGRFGCLAEMQIARDHRPVAYFRYKIRSVEMAVAVDDKARGIAEYRRGVEDFREGLGDARRADIPRDVSRKFRRRQTEVVKFRRNVVAGVIAEEDKAAGSLRAKDSRRRHVIVTPPPR